MFEIWVSVYSGDEYAETPTLAHVRLGVGEVRRILMLSRQVKRLKVYSIEEWGGPDQWTYGELDDDEERTEFDGSIDLETFHVTDDDFHYEACLKHGDTRFNTEGINLTLLKEWLKVHDTKPEDLGLMINGLEGEPAKQELQRRLKGVGNDSQEGDDGRDVPSPAEPEREVPGQHPVP